MRIKILLAASLLLLSACASGPRIVTNVGPNVNFTQFKTYNFMNPMGTDRQNGVRTPFSTMLMASMDQEMAARGLTRSDDPDLLIDFMIFTQERLDVRQTPTHSVHRSYWHRGWSTWPSYRTTVRQYTEGSLLIDIVAPAQGALIAEGSATQRINQDQFTRAQSDAVVNQIMAGIWAN